jgi:hypothetical protein
MIYTKVGLPFSDRRIVSVMDCHRQYSLLRIARPGLPASLSELRTNRPSGPFPDGGPGDQMACARTASVYGDMQLSSFLSAGGSGPGRHASQFSNRIVNEVKGVNCAAYTSPRSHW